MTMYKLPNCPCIQKIFTLPYMNLNNIFVEIAHTQTAYVRIIITISLLKNVGREQSKRVFHVPRPF